MWPYNKMTNIFNTLASMFFITFWVWDKSFKQYIFNNKQHIYKEENKMWWGNHENGFFDNFRNMMFLFFWLQNKPLNNIDITKPTGNPAGFCAVLHRKLKIRFRIF